MHELEKTKRKLESRILELEAQVEEEETARTTSEEAKRRVEDVLGQYRIKMESEILAKDSQIEETRKMLLKEVNLLGE